jgi:hypothetical protein
MWVVELHYTLILDKYLIPLVTVQHPHVPYSNVDESDIYLVLMYNVIPTPTCTIGITLYINTR